MNGDAVNVACVEGLTDEQRKLLPKLAALDHIHVTWRDYALMLVNSTADPLRSIWHEKILTSYHHWMCKDGSISEVNVNGLEVLSELPSWFTEMVVDDHYEHEGPFSWRKMGRLVGSKRMKVHIGNYPQESLSNEAYLCLRWVMQHWNDEVEPVRKRFGNLEPISASQDQAVHFRDYIQQSKLLNAMFKLAQMSNGVCVTQDEMLTYILEKPVRDGKYGAWITIFVDVMLNGIPSDKYAEYWKTGKLEGFPLNVREDRKAEVERALAGMVFDPESEKFSLDGLHGAIQRLVDAYECDLDLEQQMQLFDGFCSKYVLKEDVSYSPCYKKIAICVLKNDVSMKFCGFGSTLRERQARENAMAAFASKQEDREKAKAEALRLAKQIQSEKAAAEVNK